MKYKICLCTEKNIAIFPNSDEHENVCQTFSISVQHSAVKEKGSISCNMHSENEELHFSNKSRLM